MMHGSSPSNPSQALCCAPNTPRSPAWAPKPPSPSGSEHAGGQGTASPPGWLQAVPGISHDPRWQRAWGPAPLCCRSEHARITSELRLNLKGPG